jgi:hypothetical protein
MPSLPCKIADNAAIQQLRGVLHNCKLCELDRAARRRKKHIS